MKPAFRVARVARLYCATSGAHDSHQGVVRLLGKRLQDREPFPDRDLGEQDWNRRIRKPPGRTFKVRILVLHELDHEVRLNASYASEEFFDEVVPVEGKRVERAVVVRCRHRDALFRLESARLLRASRCAGRLHGRSRCAVRLVSRWRTGAAHHD